MKKTLLVFILLAFLTNAYAQLTPPSNLQSYYTDVDFSLSGTDLFNDLATETIAKHTNILEYGERHNYLYNVDEDITNNANVVLMYTGESRDKREYLSGNNSYNPQTFNTEHVYPQSLIVNNAKGDLHHLRTCDISVNSNRGNNPFAEGSGSYSNLGNSWYPGDEWKGDVARIMMYMYIRYGNQCKPNGVGIGSSSSTPDDMIDLFLEWNVEDPVSDFERQRNTYHENTNNTFAQGNRNPFIDNAYLATRIWGGDEAIDSWGLYITSDTEAPTVPVNILLSNNTTTSIDATWTASTDNVGVTKYEIYANSVLNGTSVNNNYTLTNLDSGNTYAITVLAKDIASNASSQSSPVNGTTLTDNTAPSVPSNITITNETGTSFKINWSASTDDSSVTGYDVFLDGTLKGTSATSTYTAIGLNSNTIYSVRVLAKDSANNQSEKSVAVNATTTAPTTLCGAETFENMPANSSSYSTLNWTGDNGIDWSAVKSRSDQTLNGRAIAIALLRDGAAGSMSSSTFANGIGSITASTMRVFGGGSGIINVLVNGNVVGTLPYSDAVQTTTISNIDIEGNIEIKIIRAGQEEDRVIIDDLTWTCYTTLSTPEENLKNLTIYPNPTNGNTLYFNFTKEVTIRMYNILGKLIKTNKINSKNNNIDISAFPKGIYLLKINSENQFITKKIIKT